MSDDLFADGRWIDPAEAGCRLLVRPAATDDPAALLAVDAVAGLLLDAGDAAAVRRQVATAHAAGRAAFVVDRPDLVRSLGADGVHLNRPAEVAAARALLDRGELIGAACGTTRHDAMVAGEDGADYVLFGVPELAPGPGLAALEELVAWWAEVAVLPCVAAGRLTAAEAARLARAGADFILPATDGDLGLLREIATVLAATQR